jgi:hypothetical protein
MNARTQANSQGLTLEIIGENLSQAALEFSENLLETTERDALGTLLQPVQCGRRKTKLPGKLSVSHLATSLFQETGKLTLQGL